MSNGLALGVVDAVWLAAKDGHWRTRDELVREVRFKAEEVAAAISLLAKYGFAESSVIEEETFRMIVGCPPPREVATVLWSAGLSPSLQVNLPEGL
jgi:hypothetical protein